MNRFTTFINSTEMVSLGSFIRTIGWFIAVVVFTVSSAIILLRDDEVYMTWGIQLAGIVVGGLLGASGIGAFNTKTIRTTSREHLEGQAKIEEAKERGKAEGTANVMTAERPAIQTGDVKQMVVHSEKTEPAAEAVGEDHEWNEGDPRAGVL